MRKNNMIANGVLFATLLLAATVAPTAHAGDTLFGSLGDLAVKARGAMAETIPSQMSAVEAAGGNFRVYFFTPPDNQALTCFIAAGTQKGGAACYPKAR